MIEVKRLCFLGIMALLATAVAASPPLEINPSSDDTPDAIHEVAAAGGKIWASWAETLYYSGNHGLSWGRFDTANGFGRGSVSALSLTDTGVWASTYYTASVNGVEYFVSDGIFASGLDFPDWQYLSIPSQTEPGNIVYDIIVDNDVIWTANWWRSLQRSYDGGLTWEQIIPDSVTFANPRERMNQRTFSVAVDGIVVWAGSQCGLGLSRDYGEHWTVLLNDNSGSGLPGNKIVALASRQGPAGREQWAACWTTFLPGEISGVAITTDTGNSWRTILPNIRTWDFLVNDSDVFIASDSGLWYTPDGGLTLTNLSRGNIPSGANVYDLAMTDDSILWVGTSYGLYRVIYSGAYWSKVDFVALAAEDTAPARPTESAIQPCYPNPFNPATTIPVTVARTGSIRLEVFDLLGRRQRTLVSGVVTAGTHIYQWDGRDDGGGEMAGGVYFCRLQSEQNVSTRQLVLIR